MLDETGRQEVWVQLIPTFTHKAMGGRQAYEYQRELCGKVARVVTDLQVSHVFWNVMNEFKHPLRNEWLKDEHILYLGQYLHDATGLPVSSDAPGEIKWLPDHAGERWIWKGRYPDIWQRAFTHLAFHPPRNVRKRDNSYAYKRWPNAEDYTRVAQRWEQFTILYNETTKSASQEEIERWELRGSDNVALSGRGTDEDRKAVIREVKQNIKAGGKRSRYFFHSQWAGIRCDPAEPLGWLPEY
jgi:hypothetical protein